MEFAYVSSNVSIKTISETRHGWRVRDRGIVRGIRFDGRHGAPPRAFVFLAGCGRYRDQN